jgi:hypothetical protein
MKSASRPRPAWMKWGLFLVGLLMIAAAVYLLLPAGKQSYQAVIAIKHGNQPAPNKSVPNVPVTGANKPNAPVTPAAPPAPYSKQLLKAIQPLLANKSIEELVLLVAGLGVMFWSLTLKSGPAVGTNISTGEAAGGPVATPEVPVLPTPTYTAPKNRRWAACNILQLAPDAKRLWQFQAKGKGFVLGGEQRVPHSDPLPGKWISKSWTSLWQPRLNVAWLPSESVFLRVVELPAASADETFSMVELQLEKLSPIPVTQIVWTMHTLGTHQSVAKADGTVETLQMIIVVIASRAAVEEFMGRLEREGFLSDRLEVPMLDQLEAVAPKSDSAWIFPITMAGQNAALVGWWFGGAWRNLSFITLPLSGDRAAELKTQIGLLAMAGEVEGWLGGQPEWNLVADPVNATEWEQLLRAALNEPVRVSPPPAAVELAGRSALRTAASTSKAQLQPEEYSQRYRQQFFDRLWLHALGYAAVVYAVYTVIYLGSAQWEGYRARGMESQVAALGDSYTNAIQLKARLAVLQERSQLKYAALDCWMVLAENMPASVSLQRFGFVDGSKLTLSGQVNADDTQKLIDFYDAMRKAKNPNDPGKQFFTEGDPLAYHQAQSTVSWNFSLQLVKTEESN